MLSALFVLAVAYVSAACALGVADAFRDLAERNRFLSLPRLP